MALLTVEQARALLPALGGETDATVQLRLDAASNEIGRWMWGQADGTGLQHHWTVARAARMLILPRECPDRSTLSLWIVSQGTMTAITDWDLDADGRTIHGWWRRGLYQATWTGRDATALVRDVERALVALALVEDGVMSVADGAYRESRRAVPIPQQRLGLLARLPGAARWL